MRSSSANIDSFDIALHVIEHDVLAQVINPVRNRHCVLSSIISFNLRIAILSVIVPDIETSMYRTDMITLFENYLVK